MDILKEYQFHLPKELIASKPIAQRGHSKLLHVNEKNQLKKHTKFYELPNLLQEGDLLIANNTYVENRRVYLKRSTGATLECLFLRKSLHTETWEVLIKKKSRLKLSEVLFSEIDTSLNFKVIKFDDTFTYLESQFPLTRTIFHRIGHIPIPPYLKRKSNSEDDQNYQSIFAKKGSSVAAPTASLHFTDSIIQDLQKKHIQLEFICLNIGYGTFQPLRESNFKNNTLHEEEYIIPTSVSKILQQKIYNRLIAVGTTSLRVLEFVHQKTSGKFNNYLEGQTSLFLYPPYNIQSVDGLITNFHLPESSLLLLVSTLLNKKLLLECYKEAIEKKYHFFSYGDAMFIEK